jgi:hypothetical protein
MPYSVFPHHIPTAGHDTEVCFACVQNSVYVTVAVSDVKSGTDRLVFNVLASSAGAEATSADNTNNVTLPLITQTDIGLSGQVMSIVQYFTLLNCE